MNEETKAVLDEFRTGLKAVEDLNARIAALESKGDSTALDKEQKDRLIADILALVAPDQKKAADRLADLEIKIARPTPERVEPDVTPEQKAAAEYRVKVQRYIADGVPPAERKAALAVNIATAAGYLAYPEFRTEVMKSAREFDGIRAIANVVTTDQQSIVWPRQTADAVAYYLGKEGGASTADTTLAFGQVEIFPHETMAYRDITWKMARNSFLDMEAYLTNQFGEAFEALWGESYINGDATGEPRGFLKNTTVLSQYSAGGKASTLESDSALRAIVTALPQPYWANASWVMSRATYGTVLGLNDANGRALIADNLDSAMPRMMKGRPIYLSPGMPAIGSNTYPIAYGDFRKGFTIVDSVQMLILRDELTQAGSATTRIYAYGASGSDVTDTSAIRVVKIATS